MRDPIIRRGGDVTEAILTCVHQDKENGGGGGGGREKGVNSVSRPTTMTVSLIRRGGGEKRDGDKLTNRGGGEVRQSSVSILSFCLSVCLYK